MSDDWLMTRAFRPAHRRALGRKMLDAAVQIGWLPHSRRRPRSEVTAYDPSKIKITIGDNTIVGLKSKTFLVDEMSLPIKAGDPVSVTSTGTVKLAWDKQSTSDDVLALDKSDEVYLRAGVLSAKELAESVFREGYTIADGRHRARFSIVGVDHVDARHIRVRLDSRAPVHDSWLVGMSLVISGETRTVLDYEGATHACMIRNVDQRPRVGHSVWIIGCEPGGPAHVDHWVCRCSASGGAGEISWDAADRRCLLCGCGWWAATTDALLGTRKKPTWPTEGCRELSLFQALDDHGAVLVTAELVRRVEALPSRPARGTRSSHRCREALGAWLARARHELGERRNDGELTVALDAELSGREYEIGPRWKIVHLPLTIV